ncbi:ferredoxin reductase [Amycolatopsis sp. NBRC 101858]|uniref:NAD(P)/FAD-dependent oxidoreductase n=1 Tax=Amycolatopsis sp. NBRC 101858 TaxID=3032200 RepID=UPI0024A39DCF|nr:FAD-dependent oxidoreductase [Amycolatopsis sp. NBRC 101858]GLY40434.1 ferredoxin reductase [Amycolatopsis sp. NBRC 101858]
MSRVLIVGAGHAGATLAGLLRQAGHRGPVELFGDEVDLPYHRPPLSKKFAQGELEQWLRPAEFYREQDITLRLGEHVVALDTAGRRVHTASGDAHDYDHLVLATGAAPRRLALPGTDLAGVVSLRTLADARILRKCVVERRALVIVGGGYIGLEVAAVARANGVNVTVLEREERVLARVASPRLSEILAGHHRGRGTRIVTGVRLTGLTGRDGRVSGAVLEDGTEIPCEAVLIGVGAEPRDELAAAAGLHCDHGVVVDGHARTSDPHVLAIGDVTRRPGFVRLESIPSATEQARQAVATITGGAPNPAEVPWFWSDQFDLKLKIAGLVPAEPATVVRGDPASGRFALFHLDGGALTAVESANSPAEFMAGKKFLASGTRLDPVRLADPATPLRDAVA